MVDPIVTEQIENSSRGIGSLEITRVVLIVANLTVLLRQRSPEATRRLIAARDLY